jgi:hypothetical protein
MSFETMIDDSFVPGPLAASAPDPGSIAPNPEPDPEPTQPDKDDDR